MSHEVLGLCVKAQRVHPTKRGLARDPRKRPQLELSSICIRTLQGHGKVKKEVLR